MNSNSSSLFGKTTNGLVVTNSQLSSLSDVTITTPNESDIIRYNSVLKKWVNVAFVTLGRTLSNLTDCLISEPSNGQLLQYSSALSKWVNATVSYISSLSQSSDCAISNPSNNDVLQYDSSSSKWVNRTLLSSRIYMKYSRIQFVNKTFFCYKYDIQIYPDIDPEYDLDKNIDACIVDQTGVDKTMVLNLPYKTGNGINTVYIQVRGTVPPIYCIQLYCVNYQPIYSAYGVWSTQGLTLQQSNTTFKLTYYENGGNAWNTENYYPCYNMEAVADTIPLNNDVDVYMINTNN